MCVSNLSKVDADTNAHIYAAWTGQDNKKMLTCMNTQTSLYIFTKQITTCTSHYETLPIYFLVTCEKKIVRYNNETWNCARIPLIEYQSDAKLASAHSGSGKHSMSVITR